MIGEVGFWSKLKKGGLGCHNPPELGFGAQKRKVGAQVRTIVRNARGPSKKSLVLSETPHGPPKKAPKNIGIFVITHRIEGFACRRKVGAQVTTFVPNSCGPSEMYLVLSENPHRPPQKAPQILEIPFFDTFAQIRSVRND